ncbi:MAG: HAMP domain-containing sensor histidine kinase [Aeromicrobium sp.]
MTAMIGTVVLVLNATSAQAADSTLRDRLDAVSATLSIDSSGVVKELETPDDVIDNSTWIFDTSGNVIDSPRAGKRVVATVRSLSQVPHRKSLESHDRVYLAAPIRDKAGTTFAVVVVTESMGPYETTRIAVVIILVLLGLLVTAGSAAIAAWTMRRALIPVEVMASSAEEWSEHDLDSRFEEFDDEIGQLGRTLNLLLDRVAGALRSEQRLTAEVAHELRTPLTAIRGEAELGQMSSADPQTAERLGRIVTLVERMTSVITTLVEIARGDAEKGSRCAATDVIALALADDRVPATIAVAIEVSGEVLLAAPSDIVVRALAPLIDNAARYASSSVRITVVPRGRAAEIVIEDDGPGIEPAGLETLFEPGSRSELGSGAGLGLALARRVARTLGGDVELVSPREPTQFSLTIPRY